MSSKAKRVVFLLTIVVLIGIVCAGAAFMNVKPPSLPLSQNRTETPIEKTLGDFRSIDGTDFLISSVTGSPDQTNIYDELFSSGRWYGGGYGYNQYNIVFFDITTETVYPLLPTTTMKLFPWRVSQNQFLFLINRHLPNQISPLHGGCFP